MATESHNNKMSADLQAEFPNWQSLGNATLALFPYDVKGSEQGLMTELHAGYTNKQVSEKGRKIYEDRIRELVEPDRIGHYVVIDVDTGDYEVDQDHLAAGLRLIDRRPNGARYGIKIGHQTAGRIGFAPFRPAL